MRLPTLLSLLVFCSLGFRPVPALAQSLSVGKKSNGDTNYWVEATANDPHTLQATANLHLWVDVHDVQGTYFLALSNLDSSQRYFRLIPSPPAAPPIRVLIIGDSMAADCCGWGRGIYGYFKDNATVINYATPWASTKVFLQSDEWDKMRLIKPDYVLMQYGFIDGGNDPDRSTTLDEFRDNLRTIAQAIRDFNGVPVFVTLHAPRLWDDNHHVIPAWQDRNGIVKQLAVEFGAPLVDLYDSTRELFNELGPEGVKFMVWEGGSPDDFMHFSLLGGQWVSRLLVNALPDSFGPYLTGILDLPPKP